MSSKRKSRAWKDEEKILDKRLLEASEDAERTTCAKLDDAVWPVAPRFLVSCAFNEDMEQARKGCLAVHSLLGSQIAALLADPLPLKWLQLVSASSSGCRMFQVLRIRGLKCVDLNEVAVYMLELEGGLQVYVTANATSEDIAFWHLLADWSGKS